MSYFTPASVPGHAKKELALSWLGMISSGTVHQNTSTDARQVDHERRAGAELTVHGNVAATLLDDPIDDRQAQPRALALSLSGEKGLKYASLGGGIHPDPGVTDRQHDVRARASAGMLADVGLVQLDIRSDDGQCPTLRHGVPRIDDQVQEGDSALLDTTQKSLIKWPPYQGGARWTNKEAVGLHGASRNGK